MVNVKDPAVKPAPWVSRISVSVRGTVAIDREGPPSSIEMMSSIRAMHAPRVTA